MEYVAFLFLGLGVLLILAGVLLQAGEKQRSKNSPLDDYASAKSAHNPAPLPARPSLKVEGNMPAVGGGLAIPREMLSEAMHTPQSVPGAFQFLQQEQPKPVEPAPPPSVSVSVQQINPRLFEKFAYLYLDSSARNVYDGVGALTAFDLSEVNGIRRFGRGVFAYDGFGFFFDHASGQERFSLTNLKTIGFYPNCIALTFRTNQPVALLFMEETESIRKVLEAFRAPHAT